MSDRDASAASSGTAEGGHGEPRVGSRGHGPVTTQAGDGIASRRAERAVPRLGATAMRVCLALAAAWLAVRWLRWSWPLLVAPPTDEVCRHLLALDEPRPVSDTKGHAPPTTAPHARTLEGGATWRQPTPQGHETAATITPDLCRASIERRLQRRGWVAAAALRHCLGSAKTLGDAATCR